MSIIELLTAIVIGALLFLLLLGLDWLSPWLVPDCSLRRWLRLWLELWLRLEGSGGLVSDRVALRLESLRLMGITIRLVII